MRSVSAIAFARHPDAAPPRVQRKPNRASRKKRGTSAVQRAFGEDRPFSCRSSMVGGRHNAVKVGIKLALQGCARGIHLACYDFCVNHHPQLSSQKAFVLGAALIALLATPLRVSAQDRGAQADEIYGRGITALQQGDLATAKADFEKVVAIQPRSPEAHNSLGWVLLAQQQVDAAIAQIGAALDLRPDLFQAHINMANAYLAKGDPKRASRSAREAIRFAPTESETYRTLAHCLDVAG